MVLLFWHATKVLSPSLVTNSQTFYAATVVRGAVTLRPSLVSNTQTFYAGTIVRGRVLLSPSLHSGTQIFYGSVVTPGVVRLSPSLFTNSSILYSSILSGRITLYPSLVADDDPFFIPVAHLGPAGDHTFRGMVCNTGTMMNG